MMKVIVFKAFILRSPIWENYYGDQTRRSASECCVCVLARLMILQLWALWIC